MVVIVRTVVTSDTVDCILLDCSYRHKNNAVLCCVFAAWGYIGHGVSQNVRLWADAAKPGVQKNGTKIIVSRSHAGDVQKVVQASLGDDTKVEPAGGAGM